MTELKPELLLQAYAVGVFPMAETRDDSRLFFVDPDHRGILPLDDFHIPRRLARTLRQGKFTIRYNHDFASVLQLCAEAAPDRPNTWINLEIERLYNVLHERGQCHSVECWQEGKLVGGLYGVALGGAFFGESMFSRARDASKIALCHLVARLRAGGFVLLDTQFITDHLAQFGTIEVARPVYKQQLQAAISTAATFFPENYPEDGDWALVSGFLQSTSQTS
ncbi:MAG: leucyl/phenylalanyl-tRNA--protein transferase [Nisaea sp.]|jgi:leucyl/phenylalanyl-tRNA--protein transferase|nr:leucyl/phenylalanyl-tRNA--protein transferase [Nisaea sp.]MDA8575164.1 leucyl/phenylalanyl-tRNA--protein transferase [Alphaproteobacteria bacterium]OUX92733.1 MAG: leucyl/phenylalanyl-tRNA--protein transferase [Candidatus Endolissoclinum sp. TMED26]|tara:strand:+ start:2038 stop:2703 length:666 start_codon:yes stop_codon:yes gene_type:complete